MDYVGSVGSGVQTELTCWTQAIFVHVSCEDKRVLNQCHHPKAVSLNGKPWPPGSSNFAVPLAIASSHPSSKTLSWPAPEPSHQPQDPPFQLQSASGPLAHSHPSWLAKGAPLQAPYMEQLRGQDPREASIHLDQACGPSEGSVGEKPQRTEGNRR